MDLKERFSVIFHLCTFKFSTLFTNNNCASIYCTKTENKALNICGCSWNAKHNELEVFCWKSAQQIFSLLSKIVLQIFRSCFPFAADSLVRTEKIPRLNSFKVGWENLCSNLNNGWERFSSGFSPHQPNWPESAHHKSVQWTSFLINKFALSQNKCMQIGITCRSTSRLESWEFVFDQQLVSQLHNFRRIEAHTSF